ncbi:MAG: ABC transporter permease [Patescibacteria group bacterium]
MTLKNNFKIAINGLKAHKMRSILTILGIVIGIAAIILIMSLGAGAQELILSQIQGLGSKTIAVAPGREPKGPTDVAQIMSDSLKEKDLLELNKKTNVPTLKNIMPIVFGGETAAFENETYRMTIFGASELIMDIFDLFPEKGFFFAEEDIKNNSSVAVIGAKIKEELFGSSEALGEKIKIKNRNFTIIGVLPKKGQVSFFNFDEIAIIPYTTAQKYIFGIKYFHRFMIEAETESDIERTVSDIKETLRNSHNITDPEKDDFFVETQADLVSRISTITNILTLFLVAVAAISLVVGGIGIMNIMLVSVTERTNEIGLRKALGATKKNILTQFIFEAIILTVSGGIIGILLGVSFSLIASFILSRFVGLNWQFTFPIEGAIIGFVVSALVGLVFGLYPARKASIKNPIEALRYE